MAIATPDMTDFNAVATAPPAVYTPTELDLNKLQQPTAAQGVATTGQQQLSGILNKGGALMQQAATYGAQQAASRGLLNSSMGVQASQAAVYDRAIPLATNDASAINAMESQNVGAKNSMASQNAQAYNQALSGNWQAVNQGAQWNAGQQNEFNKFNTTNQNAAAQWNAGQQNEAILKSLDINSRENLAGIEASYKQLMQVNSSAENMYNQVLKNVSDIQNNKDISDKQGAINSQLAWLRSGMSMIQNLNGVSGLITF